MKKLPIGLQEFRKIREGGYLYIDKTEYLCRLAQRGNYYFLSRPRRFGKSLTVSTLTELFKGSEELFEGLWAEKNWDWSQTHPVVRIGYASIGYKDIGLEAAIGERLNEIAQEYGISLEKEGNSLRLRELIEKLHAVHGPVALLIDEYDKPLIDYLDDLPTAHRHRETLKSFYTVLKDLDRQLRFVFLTGVSKFSRTSIFSELNNLEDLSRAEYFQPALGITQQELEASFDEHIEALSRKLNLSREETLSEIREWYNGYSWGDLENKVYNPFSLLNLFRQQSFENFWFESGTPTFLLKTLKKHSLHDLEGLRVSDKAFGSYGLERLYPETLLFQTGYLTIKGRTKTRGYILGYPNREVRASMLDYLLDDYSSMETARAESPALDMAESLIEGDLDALKEQVDALLSGIPYELHQKQEAYYHTVIYLAFQLMGLHVKAEVHSAKGRLDAVVEEGSRVYVFEFKVDGSAEAALEQIKARGYAKPYLGTGKEVRAIAVNFSTEPKEVDGWLVERLG